MCVIASPYLLACADDEIHGRTLIEDPISFFPFPDLGGFAFSEEAA